MGLLVQQRLVALPGLCALKLGTSRNRASSFALRFTSGMAAPAAARMENNGWDAEGDGDGSAAAATSRSSPAPSSVIQFLTLCQRLKTTKRKGWLNREVRNPESIADHMHRMAVMALVAADIPGVDRDRCVKMAVVHDIAEAIVGDITPADNVPKEEKSRREKAAIDEMCDILENGQAANEIRELWNEYESNLSPEAKLVKDFDKVEMILQALEYETAQNKELDDFFMSTAGKFQTDTGKAWAAEIVSRRDKRKEKLHAAALLSGD